MCYQLKSHHHTFGARWRHRFSIPEQWDLREGSGSLERSSSWLSSCQVIASASCFAAFPSRALTFWFPHSLPFPVPFAFSLSVPVPFLLSLRCPFSILFFLRIPCLPPSHSSLLFLLIHKFLLFLHFYLPSGPSCVFFLLLFPFPVLVPKTS